jgi:hypothetical protein
MRKHNAFRKRLVPKVSSVGEKSTPVWGCEWLLLLGTKA